MNFGLIIIGDEILSGKRADKHLPKAIELLSNRGLQVAYAHYLGDDPQRITSSLAEAFDSGDVVFSFGGIGATPDDHTRQCAAAALGRPLQLHQGARTLILERMRDIALENGHTYDPNREDNVHRLEMGRFPEGASLIPNPYNKIAGFSCQGQGDGAVHFVPGFPVMAWPMMEWVLDTLYRTHFRQDAHVELSVIVMGAMEATLTPLMQSVQDTHPVKVFSLPSVDHPQYGRHIELGVKGAPEAAGPAFETLKKGLAAFDAELGPELVRR